MNNRERDWLWRHYRQNTDAGSMHSLRDWGVAVGEEISLGLVGDAQSEKDAQERVEKLIAKWTFLLTDQNTPGKGREMSDERKIVELCMEFLEAADKRRVDRFNELLDDGVPVNFQHPKYLETAIHITCSNKFANALTERLLAHPEIDLLLRDQFGRQPWNNAELFGIDTELAERVLNATLEQVEEQQIGKDTFYQEYQEYLSEWMNSEWYFHLARRASYTTQEPE